MAKKGKKILDIGDRVHIAFPPVKPIMIDNLKRLVNLSKWITEAVEYLYGNRADIDVFFEISSDVNGQVRDDLCYRIPARISAKALEALQKDRYAVLRDSIMFLVGILQTLSLDTRPLSFVETQTTEEKRTSALDDTDDISRCNLRVLMDNFEDIMSI